MKETEQPDWNINAHNLSEQMEKLAGEVAYWGGLSADAYVRMKVANHQAKVAEAEADERVRDNMEMAGQKVTETKVRSLVIRDEAYRAAVEEAHAAERESQHARAIMVALDAKRDVLVNLGATLRQEREGYVSTRSRDDEPEPGSDDVPF